MNRKELSEIRNHFNPEAKYFTMDRVLTAFIDSQRTVRGVCLRNAGAIPSPESQILYDTMKKVLNVNIGKQSTELAFRNHAYGDDGAQTFLSSVLKSEFKQEDVALQFLGKLAEQVDSDIPYAVLACYCQYNPPRKNKMDELDVEGSDQVFRYILAAMCPIAKTEGALVYNQFDDEILRQENPNAVISKAPMDGFFFPVFSDRATDVHHVLYYTKTPNTPNEKLIDAFLECDIDTTVEEDQAGMKEVLDTLLGDDLTYETVTAVNEKLTNIVAKNKTDDSPTEVTGRVLHRLLAEAGVPEEKLVDTEKVFEEHVENTLKPERLITPKTVIKTPDIVVNVKNQAKDKVRLDKINGRHCMVIELDEAMIEVNGFDLKVPGVLEPDAIPFSET
ncbi:MAG: DUF4317 domain-containing protein [Oscillospiraceae bacterium]|nr:DUF4317 domain-containing protein [Oscillospiraceae bacterium]